MKVSKEKTYECAWKFLNRRYYVLDERYKGKDLDDLVIARIHSDLVELNEGYKETEGEFRESIILCADDGKLNSRAKFEKSVFSTFAILLPVFLGGTGLMIYLLSKDVQCWSRSEIKSILQTLQFITAALLILSLGPVIRKFVLRIDRPFFDKKFASMFGVIKAVVAGMFLSQVIVQLHYCTDSINSPSLFMTFSGFVGGATILMIIGLVGYAVLYCIGYLVDRLSMWTSDKYMKRKLANIIEKPTYLSIELTCIQDEALKNWLEKT